MSSRGETVKGDYDPQSLVYPTSSLLVLAPFERLRWPAAALVFNCISALTMASACLLLLNRLKLEDYPTACAVLFATLIGQPMREAMSLGNPALLCASLCGIAVILLFDSSRPATATAACVMLAYALALKPQLALAPAIFLLLHDKTRVTAGRAWLLFGVAMLASALGCGIRLGSLHYLTQFAADVRLSLLPGHLSDSSPRNPSSYDFLNLQALLLFALPIPTLWANCIAAAITAGLAGAVGWFWRRKDAVRNRPWTMLALLVLISLMPLYHRGYDRLLGLLLVPAIVELNEQARIEAWATAAMAVIWLTSDMFLRRWISVPVRPALELIICALLLTSLRAREGSNTAVAHGKFSRPLWADTIQSR